jgi:hypothetical protein
VTRPNEQKGRTVIRVAFNVATELIREGLNAKNLQDWADIHFRIDAIVKPNIPGRLLLVADQNEKRSK